MTTPILIGSSYDPCAWGSHLPALLACLACTDGQVLEIGVGHFSTPALHAYCGAAGRGLFSVERDPKWLVPFSHYGTGFHQMSSELPEAGLVRWGVVFIDDSPGGQNRADHFKRFIDAADFVVVHDYHHDNEEAIAPLLDSRFLNRVVTRAYQPPTLVASKTRVIPHSLRYL